MAFYLDRTFRHDKRMLVLHDVRLAFEGDRAQLDHVVVHPFGVAIVESKSVTSSVRINAADEWERAWNGRWQGMPDPLLQGERQGILLKRLLQSRHADLLEKILGLRQGTFTHMAIDVFAAISDTGTIKRARKGQASRAMKADAIPNAIVETVERHRRDGALLNPDLKAFASAPRSFKEAEMLRVAHFLRVHCEGQREAAHAPAASTGGPAAPPSFGRSGPRRAASASSPARPTEPEVAPPRPTEPPVAATPATVLACKACGSNDLEALIGKYGPYGRCRACGANTSVRPRCSSCGAPVRVERSPDGFAGACSDCGTAVSISIGAPPA